MSPETSMMNSARSRLPGEKAVMVLVASGPSGVVFRDRSLAVSPFRAAKETKGGPIIIEAHPFCQLLERFH
jgi:hypothetical protein